MSMAGIAISAGICWMPISASPRTKNNAIESSEKTVSSFTFFCFAI